MPKLNEPDSSFNEEARALAEKTGFAQDKVEAFHDEFEAYAKRREKGAETTMDFTNFGRLMNKHKVTDKSLRQQLFNLYDKDGSGLIKFEEYLQMLAVFKTGSRHLQATTLFRLCDVDGGTSRKQMHEKSLQRFELLRFVAQGIKDKDEKKMINKLASELFERLDTDSNGDIAYTEFVEKVQEDDEVWRVLQALSPLTRQLSSTDKEATYAGTIVI